MKQKTHKGCAESAKKTLDTFTDAKVIKNIK